MSDVEIRAARAEDRAEIIALLAASLGRTDDDRYPALYAWKHEENAFGRSPAWVAVAGGRLAAIRVFMRWEFRIGDRVVRAVRAVDTATHPDHQGKGLFTRLTRHGLAAMADDGVEFVFNTPNDQSRPGYLKMDWQQLGRLPVAVRPRGPGALVRLARARVPAERWSIETSVGDAAADVFADDPALGAILDTQPRSPRLTTARSVAFYRWRYSTPLLHYRVVVASGGVDHGFAVFRLRRRGGAIEAAIADVVTPGGNERAMRSLLRTVRRASGADYSIALGARPPGFVPFPRQGPILTWRHVTAAADAAPSLSDFALTLGDIELF